MYDIGDIVEIVKPSDKELKKCTLAWVSPMMDEYVGDTCEIYHKAKTGGRRQYKLVGAGGWWWDESWLVEPPEDTITCGEFEELL